MAVDVVVRGAVTRLLVAALLVEGLTPLMPFVADEFALSSSQALVLLGFCQLAMVLLQVLARPHLNRLGSWRAATLATLLLGACAVLASGSNGLLPFSVLLMMLYAVNGIGTDAMRTALRGGMAAPAGARVLALATRGAEWLQLVLPLGVAWLVVVAGWRGALVVMAAPVCLAGMWMLQGWREVRPGDTRAAPVESLRPRLLSCPSFYLPTLLGAAYQFACAPLLFGLPFLLTARTGLSPVMMGVWLSMAHALCLAAQVMGGWMLMRKSSLGTARIGLLLMAVALLSMLAARWGGPVLMNGACVLVMMAGSFIMLPCLVAAMRVPAVERNEAARLFSLVQLVAGALGLLLAGSNEIGLAPGLTLVSAISLALMLWLQPRVSWAAA